MRKIYLFFIFLFIPFVSFSQIVSINPQIDFPEYNQYYQSPGLTLQQRNVLDNIYRNYAHQIYQSNNNIINYTRQYQQLSNSARQDPKFAQAAAQVKSLLSFEVGNKKILYERMMQEGAQVVQNNQ